jgi:hypothetical protein
MRIASAIACPYGGSVNFAGRCYVTDCSYCNSPRQNNQVFFNEEWNMEETYEQWYSKIKFLENEIKLPDGRNMSKQTYITSNGFDTERFNKKLKAIYNEEHKEKVK